MPHILPPGSSSVMTPGPGPKAFERVRPSCEPTAPTEPCWPEHELHAPPPCSRKADHAEVWNAALLKLLRQQQADLLELMQEFLAETHEHYRHVVSEPQASASVAATGSVSRPPQAESRVKPEIADAAVAFPGEDLPSPTPSGSSPGHEVHTKSSHHRAKPRVDRAPSANSLASACIMSQKSHGHHGAPIRASLRVFLKSKIYEMNVLIVVIVSAALTGYQVQRMASFTGDPGITHTEMILELCFLAHYALDLGLRLFVYRRSFWRANSHGFTNMSELALFLLMGANLILERLDAQRGKYGQHVTTYRSLRILRMGRIFRIMRVLKVFRELRTLMSCLYNCFLSLTWTLMLIILTLFTFGLILTQGCNDFMYEDLGRLDMLEYQPMLSQFGGLDKTMISLFEASAGGISWGELTDSLRPLPAGYTIVFLAYIVFTFYALLNIVTGVFVDGTLQRAQRDREALIQDSQDQKQFYLKAMEDLFGELDADNSGTISASEFSLVMDDERTSAFLHAHGLDWQDVDLLFALLDSDGSGQVCQKEFLTGCLKFRGAARSVDMAVVTLQVKWVMHELGALVKSLANCEALQTGFVDWEPTTVPDWSGKWARRSAISVEEPFPAAMLLR